MLRDWVAIVVCIRSGGRVSEWMIRAGGRTDGKSASGVGQTIAAVPLNRRQATEFKGDAIQNSL